MGCQTSKGSRSQGSSLNSSGQNSEMNLKKKFSECSENTSCKLEGTSDKRVNKKSVKIDTTNLIKEKMRIQNEMKQEIQKEIQNKQRKTIQRKIRNIPDQENKHLSFQQQQRFKKEDIPQLTRTGQEEVIVSQENFSQKLNTLEVNKDQNKKFNSYFEYRGYKNETLPIINQEIHSSNLMQRRLRKLSSNNTNSTQASQNSMNQINSFQNFQEA